MLAIFYMLSCESEKRFPPKGYFPNTPSATQQLEAAYFWEPQDKLNSRYWDDASYVEVTLADLSGNKLYPDGQLNMTGTFKGIFGFNKGNDPGLTLKAGYDEEYLYILVEWKDTTVDASYYSRLWQGPPDPLKQDSTEGWTTQRNQDNLTLLFNRNDNTYDVWRWSLAYTAPFDMALNLSADAGGEISALSGSFLRINSDGSTPRDMPKYEWNGERQEVILDDGTLKILDPAYYLHDEYKMKFAGSMTGGENAFNVKADCRFCHGQNGNGIPDGETFGGSLNGTFLNKYSRGGLVDYIGSNGHEGRGAQYWGRIKNNPTDVENLISFMRGIAGVPGYVLIGPGEETDISALLNISVGGIEKSNSSYRVLLKRKLDTGNPEDVSFDPAATYLFSLRLADNDELFHMLIALMMLITWQSCEWEKMDPVDVSDLPETVSFSTHVQPIFDANCTKCHNGTTPPNLLPGDSYIELTGGAYINTDAPEDSKLYKSIDLGGGMYQYASDMDRAMILKWIEQGAEEN